MMVIPIGPQKMLRASGIMPRMAASSAISPEEKDG